MPCPECQTILTQTQNGHLCANCGMVIRDIVEPVATITTHSELFHSESRATEANENEPASQAKPQQAVTAFSWISVEVNRFSYYAMVFVLTIVATGLSYNLFIKQPRHTAHDGCRSDLTTTSSEVVQAGAYTPTPTPNCNK